MPPLQGKIYLQLTGKTNPVRPDAVSPLDGFFVLHAALPNLAPFYQADPAIAVYAIATGYHDPVRIFAEALSKEYANPYSRV